jgi:5-methylcytosine-specific restriction endonuclease McrA
MNETIQGRSCATSSCGRPALSDRRHCYVCRKGTREAWLASKRTDREREGRRQGRTVLLAAERTARAQQRAAYDRQRRSTRAAARLAVRTLEQLLEALRDQRALDTHGVRWAGVHYRWQYGTEAHYLNRVGRRLRRAAERGIVVRSDGTVTGPALRSLFEKTDQCIYCERAMPAWEKTLDHKTPLSRSGVHGLANLHVVCGRCNAAKFTRTHEEYVKQLGRRA